LSGNDHADLDEGLLEAIRGHVSSKAVKTQAEAAGMDLEALRRDAPLTYAAINAVPLLRTDARVLGRVGAVLGRLLPVHQLFNVPLTTPQTDTELRVFPRLDKAQLGALDDALGQFVGGEPGALFYRTVADRSGERRELAWPLEPEAWQAGEGLVGPFPDQNAATTWGETHTDPRAGYLYDTLPYAGGWFCDVFRGEA
jgi:hypothetical protein